MVHDRERELHATGEKGVFHSSMLLQEEKSIEHYKHFPGKSIGFSQKKETGFS